MSYDPSGGLTGWDLTGFHEGHDTECWRRLGAARDDRRRLRTWADLRHAFLGVGTKRTSRTTRR